MENQNNFTDFIQWHAAQHGMTREEYTAHYLSSNIDESLVEEGEPKEKVLKLDEYLNEAVAFGKKAIQAKLQDKLKIAYKAIEKWGDSYQGQLERVEDAITKGLDANNILHIQGDEKKDRYEIFQGNNATRLSLAIAKVINKYKKYETEQSSVPAAAGWSGTMRSTVGGKIEGRSNFSPDGRRTYLIAVTVGSGIKRSIREKIFQEVYELLFIFDEYNSSDGGVMVDSSSGTNYHTIGLTSGQYSFNRNASLGFSQIMNEQFINEGAFVVWYEDEKGKHLLGTFHNKRAAEKYKSEEEDEMLNTKGVEAVGMMSKDMWDKKEAPYIKESLNEANRSEIHKAAKKGSYPVTIVITNKGGKFDGKVAHQQRVDTPAAVPAAMKVLYKKYATWAHRFAIEDATGKILYQE